MTAKILDGKKMAAEMQSHLLGWRREILGDLQVRLVSVSLGEEGAACVYLRNQARLAEKMEIEFEKVIIPPEQEERHVIDRILQLNEDEDVSGIILQRPLPSQIDPRRLQARVSPRKDVEGMHPANIGTILYTQPRLFPCTALAAWRILLSTGIDPKGAQAVVVGHSEIVGKPVAIQLMNNLATTTVCHIGTRDLASHTINADILVVAVGKPNLIHGDMICPGATVIDIGINRVQDKQGKWHTTGDVHFPSAVTVAGAITPVPGGVGPITVTTLMENTLRAAAHANGMELPDMPLNC